MSEPWMPSAKQLIGAKNLDEIEALIRSAVEKAVAEERERLVNVTTLCNDTIAIERANHARELERAKLEAKIEALESYGVQHIGALMAVEKWKAALAALDKEGR